MQHTTTETQHTPTPWVTDSYERDERLDRLTVWAGDQPGHGDKIAEVWSSDADAEFIVTACNSHDALVEALQDSLTRACERDDKPEIERLESALKAAGVEL